MVTKSEKSFNFEYADDLLKTITNNSPVGIYVVQDKKFCYINAAFQRFTGYSGDELLGTDALNLVVVEDRNKVAENAIKMLKGLATSPYQFRAVYKDGSLRHVVESVTSISFRGRRATLGSYMDITDQKRSDEALEIQNVRFHQLFNNSPDAIVILDPQRKVVEVNHGFSTLFGYTQMEVRGRSIDDLIIPEDRIQETLGFSLEADAGKTVQAETHRKRKNGSLVDVSLVGYGIKSGSAQIGTYIIYTDISERKIAEKELKASQEQYRTLVENANEAIIVVQDGLIQFNKGAKFSGYSEQELLLRPFTEFLHPDDLGMVVDKYKKRLSGESLPDKYAYRIVARDGSIKWVDVSSVLIDWQGRPATLTFLTDITEQKAIEDENQKLREKSEISNRLAAVGEMAAGIAHEINNPLTGVIGFSELLLERTDLPENIKEDLKIIHDGSQRVKDIVRRMLTFARQTKAFKSVASINELLDNTLELRSYVLKTSNIEVVKDYDPDLPWATVDAGQLQQVFLNLIVNAEYAMKKAHGKGRLIVKTEALGDHIRISITDDGPGIPDDVKAKLFQPFFTTKAPGEGTGLGLSLSHGIIQEHGGSIRAESIVDQGTTFIIELPIIPVEIQPVPENPTLETYTAVKHGRILVVDDETSVRSFIKTILTRDGHIVEECANSESVLKVLGEATFDILLLDLRMPGMSGMELYGEISTRWPKLSHRIIFITGDTSDLNTREYLAMHQIPFITKPFDRETLEEKINSVLQNNQFPKHLSAPR